MKVKGIVTNVLTFCDKKSPTILAGFAIFGTAATGVLSYKAGLRAHDIIERHKQDMEIVEEGDKEAKRAVTSETVKDMIPLVLPPIIFGGLTMWSIFMSNRINTKRIAVLATAYSMSEKKIKEYDLKMREILGEKKTQDIKESIAKDHIAETSKFVPEDMWQYADMSGKVVAIDQYTGRPLFTNAETIGKAINKLSARSRDEMYVSLNDFYDEIGLERVPMGEDFGWNIADCVDGQLPISYTAILNESDHPCLAIEYDVWPRQDFRDLS